MAVVSAVGVVAEEAAASGAEQAARAAAAAAAKVAVRHEYCHQASKLVLHSTQLLHLESPDQDIPLQIQHLDYSLQGSIGV